VQADTKHVWLDLCAEAAICEDPTRLGQLAAQIADILDREQQLLTAGRVSMSVDESKMREGAA
jgi:hypothetical protein